MSSNAQPAVLVVGSWRHRDFEQVCARLTSDADCYFAADVSEVARRLACECPAFAVGIVVVSWPGQLRNADLHLLEQMLPGATLVCLLGSLCEGQLRTVPAATATRYLYWHEFLPWWGQHLSPRQPASGSARKTPRGLIVLDAVDRSWAEALADLLLDAGYATLWSPPARPRPMIRGAVAGIWDGSQLDDREAQQLARFSRRMSQDAAPVVALLDFPRRESLETARRAGAAAVIGKPLRGDDLVHLLGELTANRDTRATAQASSRAA